MNGFASSSPHYAISRQIESSIPVLRRLVDGLVISRHTSDVHQWLSSLSRDITSHVPLSQRQYITIPDLSANCDSQNLHWATATHLQASI